MVSTKQERQKIRLGRQGESSCQGKSSDTSKLQQAANGFISNIEAPSTSELIQYYEGDKYKTAYELTRDELGREGTVEQYQKMYKTTLHDINRYLKKERTPSASMKERFKRLYTPTSKKSLKVQIKGCVRVSNEYYYKDTTWKKPIVVPASEVNDFLKLTQENNEAGYRYLNSIYARGSTLNDNDFNWLSNVEIHMSF